MNEPRKRQDESVPAPAALDADPPFLAYLRFMRYGWRVWAGTALAGLLLGWGVTAFTPPRYSARASLEIVGLNESFLGIDEMTPTAPDSRLPQRTDMATRVRILRSENLKNAAVERLFAQAGEPLNSHWEGVVRSAAYGLEITATDDSRIVDISCQSSDPRVAAGLANALAEEFMAHERRTRLGEARETGQWMDRQLEVLAVRAESSDSRLQNYVREADLALSQPDDDGVASNSLNPLKQELLEARSERMRLQARAELLEGGDDGALPVEDAAALRDQGAKLSLLFAEKAELTAIYLPEHYKIQQLDAQIAELRLAVDKERIKVRNRLRSNYQAALRREKLLMDELESQEERAQLHQEKAIAYRIIQREAAANRELYEAFLKQVKQADLAAGVPAGAVRILDSAAIPTQPLGPRPSLGAVVGCLAGLFLGGLVVIARGRLDQTFKRPGDASRALDLRELGAVPDAAFAYQEELMTPAGFPVEQHPCAEKTCVDSRPSWLAECVRGVRTSLILGAGVPQAIAITSPTPGDGKTTVAANLAASLAESGRRTLLVDADLRRPRLHEVFEVSNSQGFVDLISDPRLSPAALYSQISQGLFLLPAGVASFGGPGLLQEESINKVLEKLRAEFDVVILDSPPALAVSDARTLARLADGAILVVRAGVTNPADALEAKSVLEQDGANLLGVVLNSWNPKVYGPRSYEKYGAMYSRPAAA